MTRRVAAAQATLDKFGGQSLVWGRRDCARLAAYCLRALGHPVRLAEWGVYRTAVSAAVALRRRGCTDMADAMDTLGLPRIPQAASLPGDILGFRHPDQPMGVALGVCLGNGRALLYLEDGRAHVVSPNMGDPAIEYMAWRADPCPR
jgi:hypothetical protein